MFEIGKGDVDWENPINLSYVINNGINNPNCFGSPDPSFEPLRLDDFVGSIDKGSPVNFYNIFLNPHGSTTHTECVGHILSGFVLHECLNQYLFNAYLLDVEISQNDEGDWVIHLDRMQLNWNKEVKACILRIINWNKEDIRYTGNNPPYLTLESVIRLRDRGIEHLLVELPSIDKEKDEGKLAGHRAWWNVIGEIRINSTITELIRVPANIKQGYYVLNLQVLRIHLDVSPSNPVLYTYKS
jgi:kynurenine formamidase